MQLNLTDYEAQLLEQRLRGRTVSFSDADHLMIQGIADRLLAGEVQRDDTWAIPETYEVRPPSRDVRSACYFTTGDPDPIKAPEDRRFHVVTGSDGNTYVGAPEDKPRPVRRKSHRITQQGDEYACSCGARWDVSDVDGHP